LGSQVLDIFGVEPFDALRNPRDDEAETGYHDSDVVDRSRNAGVVLVEDRRTEAQKSHRVADEHSLLDQMGFAAFCLAFSA
jgi:hypothetical protein